MILETISYMGAAACFTTLAAMLNKDKIKQPTTRDYIKGTYILGKPGTGKTNLCKNLFLKFIRQGYAGIWINTSGDPQELLDMIPNDIDLNRIIYLDATDTDYPFGLNLLELEANTPDAKNLVANECLSIFLGIFGHQAFGHASQDLMRNAIHACLDREGSTLLETYMLLTSEEFRKALLSTMEGDTNNPLLQSYLENEFLNQKKDKASMNPVLNKNRSFLFDSIIQNIVCQRTSSFNMFEAMREGKILICNFPNELGQLTSSLLSSIVVNKLMVATRMRKPDNTEFPCFCVFDEFQDYMNTSAQAMEVACSIFRKYNVGTIFSHQFTHQLNDKVLKSILGCVSTKYIFRIGSEDIGKLKKDIEDIEPEEMLNLPNYVCIAKELVDDIPTEARIWDTPPPPKKYNNAAMIKSISRNKYGRKRKLVEEDIRARIKMENSKIEVEGVEL